jgi:hypothetical protein
MKKEKKVFKISPTDQAKIDAIIKAKMKLFNLYHKGLRKNKITDSPETGITPHQLHTKNGFYDPASYR